ncbi:MAG TPA: GGDEF domain-containing protein [Burkholderiaceae bacterium]|nr:GGDEF domain-containing protein [Burkholderiaceae bacterium]
MPALHFQTTLLLTLLVAAAFAAGGLFIGPALSQQPAIHRKVAANTAICLGVAYRIAVGPDVTPFDYAVIWMLLSSAPLAFTSALRHAVKLPDIDRRLLLTGAAYAVLLSGSAWLFDSQQVTSLIASQTIAHSLWLGLRSSRKLHDPSLLWGRRVLSLTFGMLMVLSASHLVPRIHDIARGIEAITPTPMTYVFLLVLILWLNIGMSLTLFLQLAARVADLAHVDSLTGALNRRGLGNRLSERREQARQPIEGSVVLIDIDHFKSVNDSHGHAVGDQVLQWFAASLRGFARPTDLIVRMGGEEFLLLLPGCPVSQAAEVAQRIRDHFDRHNTLDCGGWTLRVTASFGVSTLGSHGADLQRDLARADEALYAAKRSGRNQVQIWRPSVAQAVHPFGGAHEHTLPV